MVNRKAMVPYCGGAPGLAPSSPASPGGGGGGGVGGRGGPVAAAAAATTTFLSSDVSEVAGSFMALIGGAPWGLNGSSEGGRAQIGGGSLAGPLTPIGPWPEAPRLLIGPLSAPRSPIGQGAAEPSPRPQTLSLQAEEELDGCEPDAETTADLVPSPSPSLPSLGEEREAEAAPAAADDLRKVTLAVVGRYLREVAALKGAEGGGGGGTKILQGLWDRLGSGGSPLAATAGARPQEPEVGRALETLHRVGDGILEKHHLAFQGMLRKMEIKNESDLKTVSEVAKFVFDDGITNWGRIATLISFGAFVAKHLKSINQEACINTLAEIITDVLVVDKRDWLLEHNAWEGFVKFFHVEDIEGSVRSVLMAFAGVAGIGASLAYMIR